MYLLNDLEDVPEIAVALSHDGEFSTVWIPEAPEDYLKLKPTLVAPVPSLT